MSKIEWTKLIPELSKWNNGNGIDVEDWIGINGSIELAIGYISVYWPEFVEHKDCVFLGSTVDDPTFRSWVKASNGDLKRVESTINHRHILDLFQGEKTQTSKEQVIFFGQKIKEMWELKLQSDFPERNFIIHFNAEVANSLGDYQITFYQDR